MKNKKMLLAIGLILSLILSSGMTPYAQPTEEYSEPDAALSKEIDANAVSEEYGDSGNTENPENSENTENTEGTENTEEPETPPENPNVYTIVGLPENVSVAKGTDYQLEAPKIRVNEDEELVDATSITYSVISGSSRLSVSSSGMLHGISKSSSCNVVKVVCELAVEGYTEPVTVEKTLNVYVSDPYVDDAEYSFNYYLETSRYIGLYGINQYSQISVTVSSKNLVMSETIKSSTARRYYFKPNKPGSYIITLAVDGRSIECTAELSCAYLKYNSKSVTDLKEKKWRDNETVIALYPGESTTLYAKGLPGETVATWKSSKTSIVTVTKDGVIKGKSYGDAIITAKYGDYSFRYKVSVGPKTSITALRYAAKNFNSTYSQTKRMSAGMYDCSSYSWRSYQSAGFYVGSKSYAPTAAEQAKWGASNGYIVYSGIVDSANLLPGDLIFWSGSSNGRYKGIYHVDIYTGNAKRITVPRERSFSGKISDCMVLRPNSLTTVTGLKITYKKTKTAGKNTLKWSSVYKATGYQIYRKEKNDKGYKKLKTVKGTTTFVDESVKKGKTYYYKVRPYYYNSNNSTTWYGRYSSAMSQKIK